MASITSITLILIGVVAGISSGVFGIGGGIIIVPALVYLLGFSQHLAVGTSLAVLLPPIGVVAVIEYYRQGNVDLRAALIIALALVVGAWIGAVVGNRIPAELLKLLFGIFLVVVGLYTSWSSWRTL